MISASPFRPGGDCRGQHHPFQPTTLKANKLDHDREAHLQGQIAGLVAVLSAVINALPQALRDQLPGRLDASFEPLITTMLNADGADADAGRAGAESVRDVFLASLNDRA